MRVVSVSLGAGGLGTNGRLCSDVEASPHNNVVSSCVNNRVMNLGSISYGVDMDRNRHMWGAGVGRSRNGIVAKSLVIGRACSGIGGKTQSAVVGRYRSHCGSVESCIVSSTKNMFVGTAKSDVVENSRGCVLGTVESCIVSSTKDEVACIAQSDVVDFLKSCIVNRTKKSSLVVKSDVVNSAKSEVVMLSRANERANERASERTSEQAGKRASELVTVPRAKSLESVSA